MIHCKAHIHITQNHSKFNIFIPTALLIHNSTFKTAWIVIGFVLQETIEEPKFVDLHAASKM